MVTKLKAEIGDLKDVNKNLMESIGNYNSKMEASDDQNQELSNKLLDF